MTPGNTNRVHPAINGWLRNDRRLGIAHYAVAVSLAPRKNRAPSTPASAPKTPRRSPPPRPNIPTAQPDAAPQVGADGLPDFVTTDLRQNEAAEALRQLDIHFVKACTRCGLCEERTQTVFGTGHPRPELVFVGEGPGADEDRQGIPFVGRAGQLLTRMIAAMTLTRDQVYICNIVKCRPPGNRTPTDPEMRTCAPFLFRQLAILRPRVIVTLGRPASQTLLNTNTPIGKLRGQFHHFPPADFDQPNLPTCKLMPTFHPAYLLRSPGEKAKAWSDLQQVMEYLGIPLPTAH